MRSPNCSLPFHEARDDSSLRKRVQVRSLITMELLLAHMCNILEVLCLVLQQ